MKYGLIGLGVLGVSAALYLLFFSSSEEGLSDTAIRGQVVFADNCAACHGQTLQGTDQGPPLLHPYYRPDHHNDNSFRRAVRLGVVPHHWNFGQMPPIEGVSDAELEDVIVFIREVQQINNLF